MSVTSWIKTSHSSTELKLQSVRCNCLDGAILSKQWDEILTARSTYPQFRVCVKSLFTNAAFVGLGPGVLHHVHLQKHKNYSEKSVSISQLRSSKSQWKTLVPWVSKLLWKLDCTCHTCSGCCRCVLHFHDHPWSSLTWILCLKAAKRRVYTKTMFLCHLKSNLHSTQDRRNIGGWRSVLLTLATRFLLFLTLHRTGTTTIVVAIHLLPQMQILTIIDFFPVLNFMAHFAS